MTDTPSRSRRRHRSARTRSVPSAARLPNLTETVANAVDDAVDDLAVEEVDQQREPVDHLHADPVVAGGEAVPGEEEVVRSSSAPGVATNTSELMLLL